MTVLSLRGAIEESALEIRGDGKAGGGLVLAFQSLAGLLLRDPALHVQEWPFFGSARRGASIRSFLRVGRRPVELACEVTRPRLAVLMDEAVADTVDFAQGVPPGGTFVVNTRRSPEECARRYRLSGRVITIAGDDLGERHLKHAIGNVAVYVAVAHAIGGFQQTEIEEAFVAGLERRHLPAPILARNRAALADAASAIRIGEHEESGPGDHLPVHFSGYGDLPIGAQSPLRLADQNRTASYAPSGFRLRFEDPAGACTGCAHCIVNCPEGIVRFRPDEERGLVVTGVDVNRFCKLCEECISVCPERLFHRAPVEEVDEEVPVS